MKIEKLEDILVPDSHRVELTLKDKINQIIDAITCPRCGNIKGMVGSGICFPCDQEEEEKYHKK